MFSNFVCIRSNPYLFENCGARLAALRPYFIEPYALYPLILLAFTEYSRAAEPPVRCGESHMSGLTGATLLH